MLGIVASSAAAAPLRNRDREGSEAAHSWTPHFLSAAQNNTLIALGERIVPGSADAFCNRLIDRIMTIESAKNQKELVDALAAFDRQAHDRFQKPFRELSADKQNEILTAASQPNSALLFAIRSR